MSDSSRSTPSTPSLPSVPATPLLASIVHPAPEDFFDALVGRLQRLLHEQDVPCLSADAVGQVLRALLHHDGWHSNRVWAGVTRLSRVAGVGERTVRRVLRWLRSICAVREVTGEELLRGPGPHQWPIEKRRGKLETTCYDLSGLVTLIPAAFRAAVSSPSTDIPEPAALLPGESETPPLLPPLPDPFANPAEPSSASFSLFEGTKQSVSCLVFDAEDGQAGTEKTPAPTAPPSPFAGPNMASIRRGEKSPRLAPGDEATAYRGLRGQKVSGTVARRILNDKGPRWCLTLLAYGRWMRRKKAVGPGWYVAVWQQSDDTWPDDFLDWYAKEKAHATRAKENRRPAPSSAVPVAPRRVAVPAPPSSRAAVPMPVTDVKALLAGLTEGARSALEARARAELTMEMGRAPIPPLVRSRMLLMLARQL